MSISIENDRLAKLAQQVSAETGESLTEAIIRSLEERLERLKKQRSAPDLAETLRRSAGVPAPYPISTAERPKRSWAMTRRARFAKDPSSPPSDTASDFVPC
jgi:hypothetical protein